MSQVLFIGGTKDGQRWDVKDSKHHVEVAVPMDVDLHLESPLDGRFEHHRYRREYFTGNREEFSFFVHQDVSTDEAIRMLIRGYAAVPCKVRQPRIKAWI